MVNYPVLHEIGLYDFYLLNSEIENEFSPIFEDYKIKSNNDKMSYRVSSMWRVRDVKSWHYRRGQSMDIIILVSGDYAGVMEYKKLFEFLKSMWPGGVGLNVNPGSIHLHIDRRPEKKSFIE